MTIGGKSNSADTEILHSIEELLSHVLALEGEASERYRDLAELMAAHNNHDVSGLFYRMAAIEKEHADEIRALMEQKKLAAVPVNGYQWTSAEGPETTDPAELHYLMTCHQGLLLALHNEQRAHDYFAAIAAGSADEETAQLAASLADEEAEHLNWVRDWLQRYPATESGWDNDDDPAVVQD